MSERQGLAGRHSVHAVYDQGKVSRAFGLIVETP